MAARTRGLTVEHAAAVLKVLADADGAKAGLMAMDASKLPALVEPLRKAAEDALAAVSRIGTWPAVGMRDVHAATAVDAVDVAAVLPMEPARLAEQLTQSTAAVEASEGVLSILAATYEEAGVTPARSAARLRILDGRRHGRRHGRCGRDGTADVREYATLFEPARTAAGRPRGVDSSVRTIALLLRDRDGGGDRCSGAGCSARSPMTPRPPPRGCGLSSFLQVLLLRAPARGR